MNEPALTQKLTSPDEADRYRAVQTLANQGAVSELILALRDESWRVRRDAVNGLARHPDPPGIIVTLLKMLREQHQDIGALNSVIAVMAASNVDVIVPLVELLAGDEADLRIYAALILGHQQDLRATPALLNALDDPDANVRFHAIEALGRLRAAGAVEQLGQLLASGDFFLIFPALEALSRIGEARVASQVVPLLADPLLRAAAVTTLGAVGQTEVVEPLAALLDEPQAPVNEIAAALTAVYDRYDSQFGEGTHIADRTAQAISETGLTRLLDALPNAPAASLPDLARVVGWLEGATTARALAQILSQPAARREVVEALVRHGHHVTDLLITHLQDPDAETRQTVVLALGRIGDPTAVPALIKLLAFDSDLLVPTAGALAQIGDRRAFEPLLELLGHPHAVVRQAVISAINSLGHPEMPARAAHLLQDENPRVRESAARIAGYFGYDECVDLLFAACRDADAAVRQAAVENIVYLEDERVVPTLTAVLGEDEASVRQAAVRALVFVEPRAAWPLLLAALEDDATWVRYFAARVLGQIGFVEAWQPLARLAQADPAFQVRVAAMEGLGALGGVTAVTVLAPFIEAEEPDLARAAVTALGQVAHPAALPPLLSALRHDRPELRLHAISALEQRGGQGTAGALQWTAATDEDESVVQAALTALAELGTAAAVAALVAFTANPARRELCVAALAGLGETQIDWVARGLAHEKTAVRRAVVDALARMKHPYATEQLKQALQDEDTAVRLAAESALAVLGGSSELTIDN